MRKPHLLYIAFFYPPSRASGVFRAVATSRAFVDAGWDVTVITTTPRFFEEEIGSTDESLIDFIPEGVEIVRVPFSFHSPDILTDLREMGWFQGNFPQLHRYMRDRARSARAAWNIARGRSPLAFPFKDRYLNWIEPVVKAGTRISQRKEIDHILATGNPYSSFEAARVLGALTSKAYSIDYRDPWSFDLRTGGRAKLDHQTRSAESRIVADAAACIHVNEALAEAYRNLYPDNADKQRVVMNGYDVESIGEIDPKYGEEPLELGMLGTITDLWPLGALFEGWAEARKALPAGSKLRMAGHLGYFGWSEEAILNALPDEKAGFTFEGPIEKTRVAEFYGSLDVVVVPLFGGPMVTSGKIFEAAALGIPVVCIQDRDGGAREILRDHPYGFGVEADAEQIRDALLEAANVATGLEAEDIQSVRDDMTRFERQTIMQQLVDVVTELTPDTGHE